MINEIKISDVASYSDKGVIIKPEKINYLFGANGVGKTTISRVINAPQDGNHKNCTVSWSNDQPLDVFVYNRDFIEENFDSQIDGIFTL
ncbi:MAG: AAA family ATPase, partial [Candidatus Puniceispirillales bacterium]